MTAVWDIFIGGKCTANGYRRSEEAEIIFGDVNALDLLWIGAARQIETWAAEVIGGDILEDRGLLSPDIELGYLRARP